MTAWQCDDKAWMKERRAQWKEVQKRINAMHFVDKEYKKAIKHFWAPLKIHFPNGLT